MELFLWSLAEFLVDAEASSPFIIYITQGLKIGVKIIDVQNISHLSISGQQFNRCWRVKKYSEVPSSEEMVDINDWKRFTGLDPRS